MLLNAQTKNCSSSAIPSYHQLSSLASLLSSTTKSESHPASNARSRSTTKRKYSSSKFRSIDPFRTAPYLVLYVCLCILLPLNHVVFANAEEIASTPTATSPLSSLSPSSTVSPSGDTSLGPGFPPTGTCSADSFTCDNGRCIPKRWVCDYRKFHES